MGREAGLVFISPAICRCMSEQRRNWAARRNDSSWILANPEISVQESTLLHHSMLNIYDWSSPAAYLSAYG